MNVNNDELDPITDLRLSLGHPHHCAQRRKENDSGVGANASLGVEMTFVASDPLSELVWSPHKGLSLKCQENRSFFFGAGPTDMDLSPSHSTSTAINHDKVVKQSDLQGNAGCMEARKSNVGHSLGCEEMEVMKNEIELVGQDINQETKGQRQEKNGACLGIIQPFEILETETPKVAGSDGGENGGQTEDISPKVNDPSPSAQAAFNGVVICNPISQYGDGFGGYAMLPIGQDSSVSESKQLRTPDTLTLDKRQECDLVLKEESQNKTFAPNSTNFLPLEKMESMAENDPVSSSNIASDSSTGLRNGVQKNKKGLQVDACVARPSQTNISLCASTRKGKEKAVSDGDVKERTSTEDDSHESVESCNSGGLFASGKKRLLNFEKQLIVQSKRVKRKIQETPCSASSVRDDSSFMNWISNLIKGCHKSKQNQSPSLALTLAHPDNLNEGHRLPMCSKNQERKLSDMGFHSIFQSIYRPNPKVSAKQILGSDHQRYDDCNEHGSMQKTSEIGKVPLALSASNHEVGEHNHFVNESLDQTTPADEVVSTIRAKVSGENMVRISCDNVAPHQIDSGSHSSANKHLSNQEPGVAKGTGSHHDSSLGKRKSNSSAYNGSDLPSEVKEASNVVNKTDAFGSMWITRFSPKPSGVAVNLSQCQRSTGKSRDSSPDCARFTCNTQNFVHSFKESLCQESRGYTTLDPIYDSGTVLENFANVKETSFNVKRSGGHKINLVMTSSRFRDTEAMASVFAKRLDALKHILPSESLDGETQACMTCFFCGTIGHDLRDCSRITASELEELLKNLSAYCGSEESPCLCIRCFQLNHWAVDCPNAASKKQCELESSKNFLIRPSLGVMQDEGRKPNFFESRVNENQLIGVKHPRASSNPEKHEMNGFSAKNLRANSIIAEKVCCPNYWGNTSKVLEAAHLWGAINEQIPDEPKGVFEAVKKLRLSRTDVLKWMNSAVLPSRLDGYYLRLRVGKWEEGLGGSGYYVACITDTWGLRSLEKSKRPISVNVGGTRCFVESQYVSNQDFLEDELMAWWSATSKGGGKIPSEEELRAKVE